MKKMLSSKVLVTLTLLVSFVLWWGTHHGWHKPYINIPPWDLAEYLVKSNRPPRECFDLVWFEIMAPTEAETRAQCVYEYAKLTHDPSACELIMPSSYGISCIGAAENHQLPCNTEVQPYSVYWRDGDVEHTVNVRECVTQNVHRSELGTQCCQVARIAFLKNENDCSKLKSNTPVYDRCLYALAWKLKDPAACTGITNENARAACTVQSKALAADPSICSGCTPPVESVKDLPH